jgi:predicted ATPase
MDAGMGSWREAYRRGLGLPDDPKATTSDEAADRLRRSLDELPDESRQRAADLGQDMADIEDEARRLADIIERRRRDEAATAKAEAKAKAAGHRQAWHRKRTQATTAA